MPKYTPITQIMPLASMVTGAVVSSALCDQIDDNLAALYEGVWFRATRSTTQTLTSSVVTLLSMDTLAQSDTAVDTGCVSLVSGQVQTTLTGHWMIGGFYSSSTVGIFMSLLVDSTDTAAYAAETVCDSGGGSGASALSATAVVNVTSATNTFGAYAFVVGTPTVAVGATLWGVYMGDV